MRPWRTYARVPRGPYISSGCWARGLCLGRVYERRCTHWYVLWGSSYSTGIFDIDRAPRTIQPHREDREHTEDVVAWRESDRHLVCLV